jgi:toxin CcdB
MVDIQSDIFDKLPTRLVIPLLARRANMPTAMPRSLCPSIGWNGSALVALPRLAAPYRISDRGWHRAICGRKRATSRPHSMQ